MAAGVERLKKRRQFLRVASGRRKWAAPGLVLQVAPQPRADRPADGGLRIGFTVSRKVGNAVTRNRAKRRLRAAAEEIIARQARPGHDYVVIGRRETVERPYSLLLQDLRVALKRLGVLVEPSTETGTAPDAAAPAPDADAAHTGVRTTTARTDDAQRTQ